MRQNTTKPADQTENNEEMETEEENDPDQEFEMLNSQIDQLNSVLDVLEKKNDDIQAQLVELLRSNREIRATQQQNQEEQTSEP